MNKVDEVELQLYGESLGMTKEAQEDCKRTIERLIATVRIVTVLQVLTVETAIYILYWLIQ